MSLREQNEEQGMVIEMLEAELLETQTNLKEAKAKTIMWYEEVNKESLRADVAEKERDELQKRVTELESFMRLIVNTTAHPIAETYSLSGHMNAVEYAKHMLKETHNETSK